MSSKIATAIILIMCILIGRKEKYISNPYFLFILCPISLLVYMNLGSAYMVDLTVSTINLGNINMLTFISTLYYTPDIKRRDNFINIIKTRSLEFHAVFFWILSILGRFIPPLASILWIFSVPAIVCAIKSKKIIMYCLVAIMFVTSIFSGGASKTSVMVYCVILLICFEKFFINTQKEKKKVLILCCFAAAFMVFSFSFANKDRGNYDADQGLSTYADRGIEWSYNSSFFMPYMYLTNGWTNLQYITETTHERTNGLWLAKPILGYLQLKGGLEETYKISSYSSFNTPTYIACGYIDFGYWGSLIVSILLGIFVKRIYSSYKYSKSPFDVSCYCMVALGTVEMFFSNHFLMQSYPITCVILMELYKYLFAKHRLYEPEKR